MDVGRPEPPQGRRLTKRQVVAAALLVAGLVLVAVGLRAFVPPEPETQMSVQPEPLPSSSSSSSEPEEEASEEIDEEYLVHVSI